MTVLQLFSHCCTFIISSFGFIGNVLNILLLTKLKIFRGNYCALYLTIESFVNIGQLGQFFLNEIWKLAINGVDPVNNSLAWCKMRTVLPQWYRLMASSMVCLAAIDQFLKTNPAAYLRQIGSLKIARCQICFFGFLWLLHVVPFGFFLNIQPPLGCIITNIYLANYYSFFYFSVLNTSLPVFIASLFSLLAYRNVRRIVRRQIPIDRRRLDQQLTAMIFVRVIFFVLLQLPFTIYQMYLLNRTLANINVQSNTVFQWVQVVSIALIILNHAATFYIFIATSARYRRQVKYFLVKKCWRSIKQSCCGHQNTVEPLAVRTVDLAVELT